MTIDDQYHHIATVTVRSGIYREYLHVMNTTDGWKLLHARSMGSASDAVSPRRPAGPGKHGTAAAGR
jgi:hypothetical protein